MRILPVLALLLAACEADGLGMQERPPSTPPPVDMAPGTLVQSVPQFSNHCQDLRWVTIYRDDVKLGDRGAWPGDTVYVDVRCAIGDMLTLEGTLPSGQREDVACAPGIQDPRRLSCD